MDLKQKLPLFDLKLHNHHILLCGGGGDKMYGKMNGIILCDLKMTTLFFLQTDDLIEKIELCKIKKSSNKKSKRKVRKHKDVYEIIAIGTENYYIVRCKNQRLDIVYKKNVRIENVTLDTHLYYMLNDKLMKSDIYLENKEEVTDRNNFVKDKTVTFKQNVYDFEEKIHCPIFNKTTAEMVFYTKHNNKTNVVFLKDDKQVFNIDKVTCLSENDGVVTVGTCLGEVYVFDRKRKYKKIKVYELPVTGCAYKNGWVYFSSFDGYYGRKWAFVYKKYYAIAIAIIVIFLAICVTHLQKSKDLE